MAKEAAKQGHHAPRAKYDGLQAKGTKPAPGGPRRFFDSGEHALCLEGRAPDDILPPRDAAPKPRLIPADTASGHDQQEGCCAGSGGARADAGAAAAPLLPRWKCAPPERPARPTPSRLSACSYA